jgi:ABC-type dipeptide/oligopeptide/nickel transport system permease subunit
MVRPLEAPDASLGRRLLRGAIGSLAEALLSLGLTLGILLLLLKGSGDSAVSSAARSSETAWWLLDAHGRPLWDTFSARAQATLGLVFAAALLSTGLALTVALLSVTDAASSWLQAAFALASAQPAFVLAYVLLGGEPPWLMALVALAIADWGLGDQLEAIEARLRLELARPFVKAARARGARLWRPLWRPLAATTLLSLRGRLPTMLASCVVVERVFNIAGLGDQASYAVLEDPDPVFLLWFAALGLLLSRLAHVLGRTAETLIAPPPRPPAVQGLGISALFAGAAPKAPARLALDQSRGAFGPPRFASLRVAWASIIPSRAPLFFEAAPRRRPAPGLRHQLRDSTFIARRLGGRARCRDPLRGA